MCPSPDLSQAEARTMQEFSILQISEDRVCLQRKSGALRMQSRGTPGRGTYRFSASDGLLESALRFGQFPADVRSGNCRLQGKDPGRSGASAGQGKQ